MNSKLLKAAVLALTFFVSGCELAVASLGVAGARAANKQAQKTQTAVIIQNIILALDQYKRDMGSYPMTDDPKEISNALTGFSNGPDLQDARYYKDPKWRGPYFDPDKKHYFQGKNNEAIVDAWGNPLNFRILEPKFNRFKFDVWSNGPNGINDNGELDDIRP
ncbi:type II secretion system protein GspG [bacterium]|nr:type II secretion system protein GspG [bacterium]